MSVLSESKFLIQKIAQKQLFINHLHSSIPFCLFKLPTVPKEFSNPNLCLPMSRFTDPDSLPKSSSYISIWSQSHLKTLTTPIKRNLLNASKIILKNPFKTEELINKCLQSGIKNMVIEDFQQMAKIHECRTFLKNNQKLKDPSINFIWNVSDHENDLQKIQILNSYNIQIKNLIFDESYTRKFPVVKSFIKRSNQLLKSQRRIKRVFVQTNEQNFEKSKQHFQQEKYYTNNNIQIIIENNDFTMTDKYFIGVKILGQNKNKQIIFNQQANFYITQENIKKGEIVQKDGKKWLITQIHHFPEMEKIQEHKKKGFVLNVA